MDIPTLRGIKIDTCVTSFPEENGSWVENDSILRSKLGEGYDKILRLKGQSNDIIKRKFGYELFAIEPVNQMEIEDFKKDLKCPMIRDALGNTVKKIESCGYAVLITKNEYRQVNNGRI